MLPKINRLCKKKEIDRVFKDGKSVKVGFLILKASKNKANIVRMCFIVSHKVFQNAVDRNKIKRRLREIARSLMSCLMGGRDVVIIVLPGFKIGSFKETKENMKKLFISSGLLAEEQRS